MLSKKFSFLVTGGAGFIGSHLVEKLVVQGHKVTVIDDLSTGENNVEILSNLGLKIIQADISDFEQIETCFTDIDFVIHLAAMNRAQRSVLDPIRSNIVNVTGTLNCLELSRINNVRKFIFASSSSVYKGVEDALLREDMHLEPPHPYGVGKLAAEHYCRIYNELYDMQTTVLRFFSVYGPRQRSDIDYPGVIANFVSAAKAGNPLTIFGSGKQLRNFTYIEDLINGIIDAIFISSSDNKIINLASEREYSIMEIAEVISKVTGSSSSIVHLPPINADPQRNPADISLAKEILGFQPKHDLVKGITKMIKG